MLNDEQWQSLFEEVVGAETRAYYFAEKSGRLLSIQRWLTFASLILASSAAAAFTNRMDPALGSMLALGSAALSAYSISSQTQKRAVDAADLHARWNQLGIEYGALLAEPHSPDAASRLKSLLSRASEASKAGSGFPEDAKSMVKWQKLVHAHHGLAA